MVHVKGTVHAGPSKDSLESLIQGFSVEVTFDLGLKR